MYLMIYLIIIVVMVFLSWKKTPTVFAFILSTYVLEQWFQSKDVFFIQHHKSINIINGIVVILAIVFSQLKRKRPFMDYPFIGFLVFMLFSYASVSVLWSPAENIALSNLINSLPYITLFIILTPLLIKEEKDLYQTFVFLIIFGGILSLLLLFFTEWGYRRILFADVFLDAKTNPLAVASFAGYVFFCATLLNFKKRSIFFKIFCWILTVVCLGLVVKTGSRGQFLLIVLLTLLFMPISRQIVNFKRFTIIGVSAFSIFVISYLAVQGVTKQYTDKEAARWTVERMGQDINGRLNTTSKLISVWWASPQNLMFGVGSSASYSKSISGFYTHMVPVEILGELGIFGFLMFSIIIILSYIKFKKIHRRVGDNAVNRGVLSTLAAIVLFEFLLSCKQGSLLGSPILFCVIIVLAKFEISTREIKSFTTATSVKRLGNKFQTGNC